MIRALSPSILCLVVANGTAYSMSSEKRQAILAPTMSFENAEKWESLPGGLATNRKRFDREAFSQPAEYLSFEERSTFFVGNGLFRRLWVTAPASTKSSDGLGPLFNARACQRCHLKDGRGHPPFDATDSSVSMFLRLSIPPRNKTEAEASASGRSSVIAEPTYGGQLQELAISGFSAEGRMLISYENTTVHLADGTKVILRKPTDTAVNLANGPLHSKTMLSPRVAPPMIGLGLLEAIAEKDILAIVDPDDSDDDGISGAVNRVGSRERKKVVLGRFGWKAG
jgi:CxxC motif-containing protein (DUF1111 family)